MTLSWDLLWDVLRPEFSMGQDILLALVPVGLAFWLFRFSRRRAWFWWVGLLVFVLFLPNAPYVVTDMIHFIAKVRRDPDVPDWMIALFVVPQYTLYIGCGVQSYVLSLVLLGRYLSRQGLANWILRVELALHAISAAGVYIGRFLRLNSWDALEHPEMVVEQTVEAFDTTLSAAILAVSFVILAGGYSILKFIDLAVLDRGDGQRG